MGFPVSQPEGAVSLGLKHVIRPDGSQVAFRAALSFVLYRGPGPAQETLPEDSSLPQYDLHAETEIKGLIDEVNLLSLGTRKAFGEPVIKNGDDRVHIYLCTKPFQQEMGIGFKKGQVPDVGSKVKQDLSDVILARKLVKDMDTLSAPRRQDQAGVRLANLQVSTGKEAR
jgi:hypothetical protein